MDKKEEALIIKENILSKMAQNQTPQVLDSSSQTVNIGSGLPFLKPMKGTEILGWSVAKPTAEAISNDIATFLYSLGYQADTKIDPANYDVLANMLRNYLYQKYSGYLQYVNPNYIK